MAAMSGVENTFTKLLRELRRSGEYSDLTIKCGSLEIRAHKNIVCPQSAFFAAACKKGWKESTTGLIELQAANINNADNIGCDNPHAIELMIDFLYCRDYEVQPGRSMKAMLQAQEAEATAASGETQTGRSTQKSQVSTGVLAMHVEVYALGDKYDIQPLRRLAIKKYKEATRYPYGKMSAQFIESMATAFSTTANPEEDEFCILIIKLIIDYRSYLVNDEAFESAVAEIPGLAWRLFKGTSI